MPKFALAQRLGHSNLPAGYFQIQLLRNLDYILDVEADGNFPSMVDCRYSYQKEDFAHSQLIHRSGTCFVQCLTVEEGYLFLKNRLYLSHLRQSGSGSGAAGGGRGGAGSLGLTRMGTGVFTDPEVLLRELQNICEDAEELQGRWDEILAGLVVAAPGSMVGHEAAAPGDESFESSSLVSSMSRTLLGGRRPVTGSRRSSFTGEGIDSTRSVPSDSVAFGSISSAAEYPLPSSLAESLPALEESSDEDEDEEQDHRGKGMKAGAEHAD